jgi:hypothetical protein
MARTQEIMQTLVWIACSLARAHSEYLRNTKENANENLCEDAWINLFYPMDQRTTDTGHVIKITIN